MAYIKVDHSKFGPAAQEIDQYIQEIKKQMKSAEGEVKDLTTGNGWQGTDAQAFQNQWKQATNNDSVYRQMIKALEAYADYLRFAQGKYRNAQANAINRANRLPRY